MPNYSSKKQVEKALAKARKELANARNAKPKDEARIAKAQKEVNDVFYVYDRWDALHS